MQSFDSDGVQIAYLDEGAGEPILLIHGFASNAATNWVDPQWVRTLTQDRRRVIALDNRGHGQSDKLYDPARYGAPEMADDAIRLLDHLKIDRVDVLGYSMGARIAAFLAIAHPDRVRSVVFGGLGIHMVRGMVGAGPLAAALEAPKLEDVTNDTARSFRIFAEQTNSDLKALAACMRGPREKLPPEKLGTLTVPVIVAVGSKDVIGGSGAALAELIPNAQFLDIVDSDHMRAVSDKKFKQGVLAFLASRL